MLRAVIATRRVGVVGVVIDRVPCDKLVQDVSGHLESARRQQVEQEDRESAAER